MDFFGSGGSSSQSGLSDSGQWYGQNLWNDISDRNAWNVGNTSYNSVNPTMNLDNLGLTGGQREGFDQAVKTALGQFSGNAASQGFLTPQNTGSIAGSAAQYVMPQFASLMSDNLNSLYGQRMNNSMNNMQADMFNRQLAFNGRAARFGNMNNFLNHYMSSSSDSSGPGIGNMWAQQFGHIFNAPEMMQGMGAMMGGGGKMPV